MFQLQKCRKEQGHLRKRGIVKLLGTARPPPPPSKMAALMPLTNDVRLDYSLRKSLRRINTRIKNWSTVCINQHKIRQQPLSVETRTVTGRTETQGYKNPTNKQTEVTRPLGQNYAVAKQPGDPLKSLSMGDSLVCVRAFTRCCVCVCTQVCVCEWLSWLSVDTDSDRAAGSRTPRQATQLFAPWHL